MSSRQEDSNGFDLEKLNDQDKTELRQFVAKTQQRMQIQSQTHKLTQMCWKKCVSGSIKNAQLGRSEETCLTNCVERFLDLSLVTVKHLTKGAE